MVVGTQGAKEIMCTLRGESNIRMDEIARISVLADEWAYY